MKKIVVILLALVVTTGCVNIKNTSLEDLTDMVINSKYSLYNHVNQGFKYYLPRTLKSVITDEYNEIIKSKYYDYYLYVDLVAYYNKKVSTYNQDNSLYYSRVINKDDKTGLINIDNIDNEYIVNIEYNYASIEVKCNEEDLNEVVTSSLVILSSIKYNDDVIENLLADDVLSSAEEQITIFDNQGDESNTLDVVEDVYTGNEEEDYDPDVIN